MKITSCLLLGIVFPATLFADDLVTKSGKKYYDYAIVGAAPNGIRIFHASGSSVIRLKDFPDDLPENKKILIEKYAKDIPAAKTKYAKKQAERKKKQAANAKKIKEEEARIKKSEAQIKKDKAAEQALQKKIQTKSKFTKKDVLNKKD